MPSETDLRIWREALPFLCRRSFPDRRELDDFHDWRLRELVAHAFETVPFLRKRWEASGVDPSQIRGRQDLERLPLLRKTDYQQAGSRSLSLAAPGSLVRRRTSGSTGRPFVVTCSLAEDRLLSLLRWRNYGRLGVRWYFRVATLRPPRVIRLVPRILRFGARLPLVSIRYVDVTRELEDLAATLSRLQPHVIMGFPTLLNEIGALLPEYPMHPRLIVVGGEKVLVAVRRSLSSRFGCPVREVYGCHEFGAVAWECPETGLLHLSEEVVLPEVLREDGSPAQCGERGELVGTALHSFTQPFVRYRLEDEVTVGPTPCPCGAPYRTLVVVEGRQIERLLTASGRSISGAGLLEDIGERFSWVRQYQLVQESLEAVTLRFVAQVPPSRDQIAELEGFLDAALGRWFRTRAVAVTEISRDSEGKYRLVAVLPRR
ncbi:MAG: phenylacetate--CoA ligase family protein [Acidobacteriota bacterium]